MWTVKIQPTFEVVASNHHLTSRDVQEIETLTVASVRTADLIGNFNDFDVRQVRWRKYSVIFEVHETSSTIYLTSLATWRPDLLADLDWARIVKKMIVRLLAKSLIEHARELAEKYGFDFDIFDSGTGQVDVGVASGGTISYHGPSYDHLAKRLVDEARNGIAWPRIVIASASGSGKTSNVAALITALCARILTDRALGQTPLKDVQSMDASNYQDCMRLAGNGELRLEPAKAGLYETVSDTLRRTQFEDECNVALRSLLTCLQTEQSLSEGFGVSERSSVHRLVRNHIAFSLFASVGADARTVSNEFNTSCGWLGRRVRGGRRSSQASRSTIPRQIARLLSSVEWNAEVRKTVSRHSLSHCSGSSKSMSTFRPATICFDTVPLNVGLRRERLLTQRASTLQPTYIATRVAGVRKHLNTELVAALHDHMVMYGKTSECLGHFEFDKTDTKNRSERKLDLREISNCCLTLLSDGSTAYMPLQTHWCDFRNLEDLR